MTAERGHALDRLRDLAHAHRRVPRRRADLIRDGDAQEPAAGGAGKPDCKRKTIRTSQC